jgi:hypothetical protein
MATDDVFPAEMPSHPPRPISPLDDNTAERLLSGRLDPDDAPPSYADVARLFQAAAAPAGPDELAGEAEALTLFRAGWAKGAGVEARSGQRSRRAGVGARSGLGRGRGRLVAVALAGVLGPAGSGAVTDGERVVARHTGGGGSRGGGAGHGAKPVHARGAKAPDARAGEAKADKAKAPMPGKPVPRKSASKGPKATPGQGANHPGGRAR